MRAVAGASNLLPTHISWAATKAAPPVKAARTSAKGTAKPAKAAKPAVPAKAKRAAR